MSQALKQKAGEPGFQPKPSSAPTKEEPAVKRLTPALGITEKVTPLD